MAITDKEQGVWILDEVYNKINEGGIWDYSEVYGLWTWGKGGEGSLGDSTRTSRSSPVQVPGGNWVGLWNNSGGARDYVFAAQSANEFWSWGSNSYGSLAQGPGSPGHRRSSPVQVPGSWSNVVFGFYGGFGVKTSGELFTWGYDSDGQLGLGPGGGSKSSPTQVGTDTSWSGSDYHLSQGGYAGGALKTDGTLWMWGENQSGELGQSNKTKESSPKQVGTNTTWSSISIGGGNAEGHAVALKTDGTAWAWGHNANGTLGQGNTTQYSSPKQIPGTNWARVASSSGRYCWGVKTDGTFWTWGYGDGGVLAHNDTSSYSSPKQVPGTDWDKDKICAASEAIAAVKTDGTLWVWGNGEMGWLGLNSQTRYSSPVQVPGSWHDVLVKSQGMAALKQL
jgi:alpha-tubulin suppressor-like RCC1 family protein